MKNVKLMSDEALEDWFSVLLDKIRDQDYKLTAYEKQSLTETEEERHSRRVFGRRA